MRRCVLFFVCILMIFYDPARGSNLKEHARKRRGALSFHELIRCHQPDVVVLANYGDYGCFCGPGGKGSPVDATDRCCQAHDRCYKNHDDDKNWTFWSWFCGHLCISYSFSCKNKSITCEEGTALGKAICECDKVASECFAAAMDTYHKNKSNLNPTISCSETFNNSELLPPTETHSTSTTQMDVTSSKHISNVHVTRPTVHGRYNNEDNTTRVQQGGRGDVLKLEPKWTLITFLAVSLLF